jgi:hypothetical protein
MSSVLAAAPAAAYAVLPPSIYISYLKKFTSKIQKNYVPDFF